MTNPKRREAARDIRVEELYGRVLIYDKLGSGHIEIPAEDAEHVRDELDTVLDK